MNLTDELSQIQAKLRELRRREAEILQGMAAQPAHPDVLAFAPRPGWPIRRLKEFRPNQAEGSRISRGSPGAMEV